MALPALPGVSGSDKVANDRASNVIEGLISGVGPGKAFSAYGPLNFVAYGVLADALTTAAGTLAATVASATLVAAGQAINSANVPPGATVGAITGTDVTLALPPQYWRGRVTPNSAVVEITDGPASLATLVGATVSNEYFAAGTTVSSVDEAARTITLSAAPATDPAGKNPTWFEFAVTGNAITVTGEDAAATITGAAIAFDADFQLERSFDGGATWVVCNVGGSGQLAQFTANAPVSVAFGDPEECVLYRVNCYAHTPVANVTIAYRISTTGIGSMSMLVPSL